MRLKSVCWTVLGALLLCGGNAVLAQGVCDGVSQATNTTQVETVVVANGLNRPLFVASPPGDTERLVIVQRSGILSLLKRGQAPNAYTTFMDIQSIVNDSGNEQGLLGLAFHPDYATNGYFYVNYSDNTGGDTIIARFTRLNADQGNPATQRIILTVDQPESNHNGGWIGFGPDGYLYIATGDGGGGGDGHGACGNGQSQTTLLGKMLRIDVDNLATSVSSDCDSGPYKVPADNPFVNGPGGACDEIWAYGLRNPWRNAFDSANGDLYMGDVGQGCWEEINYQPGTSTGGENYGWRQMEGTRCYNPSQGCGATSAANCTPACNDPGLTLPVLDYSRSGGNCSVTGGVVYRGCRMPNLHGKYFYGDYCVGQIRSFEVAGGVATGFQNWAALNAGFGLLTFGTDAQGEMYIGDESPGEVRKVLPALSTLEVSGLGADQLMLAKTSQWTWEDLQFNSMHPLSLYRVYRADFSGPYDPAGVFRCIHDDPTTAWAPAGDPVDPGLGELYAYVVTARNFGGDETGPGGTPTRLTNCP